MTDIVKENTNIQGGKLMRIHNQDQISFSVNRYQKNTNQIEKSLQKLSSGLKIATAQDNASGVSISETMRAQIRGISQAQSNMQDGLSVLEAANEGLNNVNGLLQNIRELTVRSANDTMSESDRAASQQEIQQLLQSIDDTASRMEFNTKKILGEDTSLILMVGANPGQQISIDLIDTSTAALEIEDISVMTNEAANQAITKLDNAIRQTTSHLTKVGAYMESIEHHLQNALVFEANLSKSLSLLEDTDLAHEMLNFINLDIRQQGDQLLVSQVNKNTQDILGLLTK